MSIGHLSIRLFLPVIWRVSRRRKITSLQEFANTELDSAWQSLYALKYIEDPKIKWMLFQHALEEFQHADLFNRLSARLAKGPLAHSFYTREALIKKGDQDVLDFLVYLYVGEREINQDFIQYIRAPIDQEIRDVFKQIKAEEEGHEDAALSSLEKIASRSQRNLKLLIWKHKLSRSYRQFASVMKMVGEFPLSVLLSAAYFFLGFFAFKSVRARFDISRAAQLALVSQQAQSFKESLK